MTTLLVAFYFSIMIPERDYPLVIGPYTEWMECASVREWLDRRGYETTGCLLMPFPQESLELEVFHLPLEE